MGIEDVWGAVVSALNSSVAKWMDINGRFLGAEPNREKRQALACPQTIRAYAAGLGLRGERACFIDGEYCFACRWSFRSLCWLRGRRGALQDAAVPINFPATYVVGEFES